MVMFMYFGVCKGFFNFKYWKEKQLSVFSVNVHFFYFRSKSGGRITSCYATLKK